MRHQHASPTSKALVVARCAAVTPVPSKSAAITATAQKSLLRRGTPDRSHFCDDRKLARSTNLNDSTPRKCSATAHAGRQRTITLLLRAIAVRCAQQTMDVSGRRPDILEIARLCSRGFSRSAAREVLAGPRRAQDRFPVTVSGPPRRAKGERRPTFRVWLCIRQ